MFKNVASQKIAVFAFDVTTGQPKTGDAANITCYVNKDWAGVNALTDTSASEISSTNAAGWYLFDTTQSETNADALHFTGKSSTANISIVGQVIYTVPASFTSFTAPLDAAGVRSAVGLASANLDTQLSTIDDFLDTEIAAIKAKTDNLPSDPADASDIAASFSTVNSTLSTIAGYVDTEVAAILAAVDTEVAAIKAKTDNLPASPAASGDAMTLTSAYDYAKGTVAMTEAYAANGVAPSPVQALYAIQQMLTMFAISGTSLTVKKLDASTTAFVVTLNDASNPTAATRS